MALTVDQQAQIDRILLTSSGLTGDIVATITAGIGDLPELEDINVAAVTDPTVGAFPLMFKSLMDILSGLVTTGSITKDALVKIMAESVPAVMGASTDFVLQKQAATFNAATARMAAEGAVVQTEILKAQLGTARAEAATAEYTYTEVLPERKSLAHEQAEQARAATSSVRLDGVVVTGSVGKQVELYGQQMESYANADRLKFVNGVYLNTWTVRKSVDTGVVVPDALSDTNMNSSIAATKSLLGI